MSSSESGGKGGGSAMSDNSLRFAIWELDGKVEAGG